MTISELKTNITYYKRKLWVAIKAPEIGPLAPPEIFELEPTNSCNLRCRMCHVSLCDLENSDNFDISLLDKMSIMRGKWVSVSSNFEPLMHQQFVQIIKKLSDMDLKISLTTNGTMLKPEIIDKISGSNIKDITFSFDAIKKETYENIRRRANHESTIENIKYFRKKFPETYVAINAVLMKSNIDELVEMAEFWDSVGINQLRLIFMVLRSLDDDIVKESLYPMREYAFRELDKVAEHIIDNKKRITLSSPYYKGSPLREKYPDNINGHLVKSDNPESKEYFNPRHHHQLGTWPRIKVPCKSPFTLARVLNNGDVQLCNRFVVGNLNENDFSEIWNGAEANKFRKMIIANPSVCYECDFYRFCLKSKDIDINLKENYFQKNLIPEIKKVLFK